MRGPDYLGDGKSKPPSPDYLKKAPTTDLSSAHERETAKKFGAQRVSGSGAVHGNATSRNRGRNRVQGRPGDVRGIKDLQELKATDKIDETRIQIKWLQKIAEEAITQGKYPVVNMRFTKLQIPAPEDWVLIPADVYKQLRGED